MHLLYGTSSHFPNGDLVPRSVGGFGYVKHADYEIIPLPKARLLRALTEALCSPTLRWNQVTTYLSARFSAVLAE